MSREQKQSTTQQYKYFLPTGPAPPTIEFHVPTGTWALSADGALWLYPDTNAHLDCIYYRNNGTPTWSWNNTGIARLKSHEVVKEFQMPKEYAERDYPRGKYISGACSYK
jgi:hypothetical protein